MSECINWKENQTEKDCENCEFRNWFSRFLGVHWLGGEDCPLCCDCENCEQYGNSCTGKR